jgi:hypothetical protein
MYVVERAIIHAYKTNCRSNHCCHSGISSSEGPNRLSNRGTSSVNGRPHRIRTERRRSAPETAEDERCRPEENRGSTTKTLGGSQEAARGKLPGSRAEAQTETQRCRKTTDYRGHQEALGIAPRAKDRREARTAEIGFQEREADGCTGSVVDLTSTAGRESRRRHSRAGSPKIRRRRVWRMDLP